MEFEEVAQECLGVGWEVGLEIEGADVFVRGYEFGQVPFDGACDDAALLGDLFDAFPLFEEGECG